MVWFFSVCDHTLYCCSATWFTFTVGWLLDGRKVWKHRGVFITELQFRIGLSGVRIWRFCNWIGSEIFSWTPHPIRIRKFKIIDSDIQSISETAHSVPNILANVQLSILPHEAKVVTILPLFRCDWLKWSHDKYDTHKKTRVRVKD